MYLHLRGQVSSPKTQPELDIVTCEYKAVNETKFPASIPHGYLQLLGAFYSGAHNVSEWIKEPGGRGLFPC